MRVADYMVQSLGDLGVEDVFTVYGGASAALIDAFTQTDKTRYVTSLTEQGAGFAAEGYSRVRGLGAAIATSGPGAQNFLNPIAGCFYDSIPVIFLTGNAPSMFLKKKGDGVRQYGFQEFDVVEAVRNVTKHASQISDPKQARIEFEKAAHMATSGRPGPVLLDIPADIQEREMPEQSEGFTPNPNTYDFGAIQKQIDTFIGDLKEAERPTIIIGGGVRLAGATKELSELESQLRVPLFPTWSATDVVTSDNPNYGGRIGVCGGKGRNFGVQNSDLILTLGSRLSPRVTGGAGAEHFAREAKIYMVDVDGESLRSPSQVVTLDEKIHCDAREFLCMLNDRLKSETLPSFDSWNQWVLQRRDKYDPVRPEFFEKDSNEGHVHPYAFMRILSEVVGENVIINSDAGGNVTIFGQAFETKQGQRTFSNYGNSSMGFSFPSAIGSWFADKSRKVISIIGDGGMMMNMQELQALRLHNIPLKTIVLNNHVYGFTLQFQQNKFGRGEACAEPSYSPADFVKVAEAFGIPAMRISENDPVKIRGKLTDLLKTDGPVVCDVDTGHFHNYAPRVLGTNPLEYMDPELTPKEFRDNMIIPPIR